MANRAFNPFANGRLNQNPPIPRQPEQAPGNGPNPFNRANRPNRPNRPAGINPPFLFNQQPREPRWNLRGDGQWNINAQRQPNRATAYNADQEYAQFQARAFGLPQVPPQGPNVAPPPVGGAPPPPPPAQPAQPAPPARAVPLAPRALRGPGIIPPPGNGAVPPPPPPAPPPPPPAAPAPAGGEQPNQNQRAEPPVILLGRNGNAGTGRELTVPPLIAIYNLGQDLHGHVHTVVAAVEGFVNAVLAAVVDLAGPLVHFATRWAVFLFFAAFALWASIPTILRVLVAVHRAFAMFLVALLEALAWAFNVSIKWPRANVVGYTLRPEYMSRAVTGMAFLEPVVCPVGDGIRGPPYGATALFSADTMFTWPFPLSLPPIRTVWTIFWSLYWSLLIAIVSAVLWVLGAALAMDLRLFPSEIRQ